MDRTKDVVDSPERTQFSPLLMIINDYWLLIIETTGTVLLVVITICAVQGKVMLRIQLQPFVAALVGLPLDTDVGNV